MRTFQKRTVLSAPPLSGRPLMAKQQNVHKDPIAKDMSMVRFLPLMSEARACSKGPTMTHHPRGPGAFPYICPHGRGQGRAIRKVKGEGTTTWTQVDHMRKKLLSLSNRPKDSFNLINAKLARLKRPVKSMPFSATFTSPCPSLPWPPCPNIPNLQGLVSRARIELETKCRLAEIDCKLQDARWENAQHQRICSTSSLSRLWRLLACSSPRSGTKAVVSFWCPCLQNFSHFIPTSLPVASIFPAMWNLYIAA